MTEAIFTKVSLMTGPDGRAAFAEEEIPLNQGTPVARLSRLYPTGGMQLRNSPVGFRSSPHCSPHEQWVFILAGKMEIGLPNGSSRIFGPGEHFYSADTLPVGQIFNPEVNGHWSAQVGPDPLVTLFVRP